MTWNPMNDRFNFRVWFEGRFIYKSLCDSGVYTKDDKFICPANTLPDLPWEQCTGLKDKKGKLIYEGDIVSYKVPSGKYSGAVRWDKNTGGWLKSAGGDALHTYIKTVEVIGNIHEKKELLK